MLNSLTCVAFDPPQAAGAVTFATVLRTNRPPRKYNLNQRQAARFISAAFRVSASAEAGHLTTYLWPKDQFSLDILRVKCWPGVVPN